MKIRVFAIAIAGLLLAGCGQENGSTTAATTSSTNAASENSSGGYLQAITRGQQRAESTVDTTSISQAINLFNVEKGRYPKDLNELVQEKYLPRLPTPPHGTRLDYDPNTGKVTVVAQ